MYINENYQKEIIGILANKPKYFNSTILTKEYFDKPLDYMFEKMRLLYKKEKVINSLEIVEDKNIDEVLYVDCLINTLHTYEEYFKSLERQAIERYKEKLIREYNVRLTRGDIDVNKFTSLVDDLKKIKVVETSKLNGDKIRNFMTSKNKLIKFNNYKKLNIFSKIKEHDLVVVAGKTGTGKTGYALNLLNDLSKTYPCLYINIELAEDVIVQRLTSLNTEIAMNKLDNCETLPQKEINKIKKYADELDSNDNISIVTGSKTINEIKSLIGSFEQDKHYIVFIDHIGRIKGYGKGLYEKTTNNVIELRNLCLDFNCTIIALCQLSRESKNADIPSLDLLRDSGEVEQSARKVMFVWEDKDGKYSLWFCKNDSGGLYRIPVYYNKEIQKFTEIERIRE
ncbi:MAG: DnaB-like helicase C-terminal domain-containing protein [Longibaculum sp.]